MPRGMPVDTTVNITGQATAAKQDDQLTQLTTIATLAAIRQQDNVALPNPSYGILPMGIRTDTMGTLGTTDGRPTFLRLSSRGALQVASDTRLDPTNDTISHGMSSLRTPVTWAPFRRTTSGAGLAIFTPTSGKRAGTKWIEVMWSGANACRITIWVAVAADTTYDGTEETLFDKDVAANSDSGFAFAWPMDAPKESAITNGVVKITLSADKTVTVLGGGYEIT